MSDAARYTNTQISVWIPGFRSIGYIPSVRKNAAHKESSEKSLTSKSKVQWQAQTARLAGKDGAAPTLGQVWLLYKGEVKEVSACAGVSGRGGAVLEPGNLSLGVSQVRSEVKWLPI
jgi:hypothetical protein